MPPRVLDLRFSDRLRELREQHGLSLRGLARMVPCSHVHIHQMEQGRNVPSKELVGRLDDILDTGGELTALFMGEEVETTNRRQLFETAAGLAGLSMVGVPGRQVAASPPDGPIMDELLTIVTGAYRRLESTQPSGLLIAPVTSCLKLVRDVIRGNEPASGRMHAVLSEVAGLAAWLQVDLQNIAAARRYYRLAVDAAERSGHPLLPTYMRASLGQFAAEAGDTGHGVDLVRSARNRLPRNAPTVAHVWMDAVEARALAERRDQEALELIRRSQGRLAAVSSDQPIWPWVFKFDEPKLAAYHAVCATRLGKTAEARSALAEAAVAVQTPKQHAALQVEHARTLWGDGEAESSCALAVAALDTAYALESERVRHMVRSLRTAMGDRAAPVTAELDERLASAYQVGT